jgi:hypothetical protein
MTRRPAVTVIEALMAIFVMAIGLLALLTLFPLGAVSMWQALKDQRTAETSINATSQYKAFGIGGDSSVVISSPAGSATTIFENPWPAATAGAPGVPSLATASTYIGPTYPVFVDPIQAAAVPAGGWVTAVSVGTAPAGPWPTMGGVVRGIPRTTTSVLPSGRTAQCWCTLQDDITYSDSGLPDTSPGYVQREGRYSFAYMVRRSNVGDTGPLDLTVVVYSGRSPGADAAGNPLGETVYGDASGATGTVTWGATAAGTADPTTVTINWTGVPTKPALRRGSWVLDARLTDTTGAAAPQGYFYRVVSVADVAANVMEVVVQRPLGGQLRAPNGVGVTGPLVVVDNVAEVFEKGTIY